MRTFKTLDLVSQDQEVPIGVIPFLLVMNEAKWEALPPEVQDTVMKHGGDTMATNAGRAYSAVGEEIRKSVVDSGKIEIVEPDDAAMEKYRQMAQTGV